MPTANGQSQLIYETLMRFNLLDGSLQPGLAKELQEPEPGVLVLPLQEGTTWSDGTELTADDVVFTFELADKVALGYSNAWTYLESVEAIDPRTVRFTVKKKPYNPGSVKDAIAATFIVPKHVWASVDPEQILKETNLERSAAVRSPSSGMTRPRSTSRASTTTGARRSSGPRP
ncbi:MAG TPA: ABC transporter substrate-binding protein [Microlunatus sp.]|nr:ABC transporter substrate-binding protein [Microlunatus sp.]